MNFKKAISAISALAITVSCFAGLAITANAEATTETATYIRLANFSADNKTKTSTTVQKISTDADFASTKVHGGVGPSSNSSNYPAIGLFQFTFDNTENLTISSAKLSGKLAVSGSNRTANVYTVADSDYDISTLPMYSTAENPNSGIYTQTEIGSKWTYSNIMGAFTSIYVGTGLSGTTNLDIDVTDYIKAQEKSTDNKYYALFACSNANAGADITDPVLTITYADASAVEKTITINYVYGDENTAVPTESLPVSAKITDTAYSGTTYTYEDYPTTFDAEEEGTVYRYTFAGETSDATIASVAKDSDNAITLKYTRAALAKKDVLIKLVDKTSKETIKTIVDQKDVVESTEINYAYPMYITDDAGKVTHKCSATTYTGKLTVSETDANNTVSIEYEAFSGDAWFVEAENVYKNTTPVSDSHFSGGDARRSINSFKEYMNVPVSGIYKITYASCTSNAGSNSDGTPKGGYISLYKNSQTEDNLLATSVGLTGTWNNMTVTTVSDVSLAKGDKIYTLATQTTGCLDYVLLEKTGDLSVAVATPSVVASAPALASPTGKIGTEPTFDDIASHLEGYALLKVDVTNPLENVYPKVTIKDTDYQLAADDITAVEGENNTVSYYIAFKAATQADLADFGTVTVYYGNTENHQSTTHNFAAG